MTGRTSLSTWAIRNPVPPLVLFLVLTLAGIVAYLWLPVANMPAIEVPIISVQVSQPGATPTEIETQITAKVEAALSGLPGVKHLTSTIVEASSESVVEFALDTDLDRAVSDVRDAVAGIRDRLPATITEPVVRREEMDGGPTLAYVLEAPDLSREDASWFVDDVLTRELMSISGVAAVKRLGGTDREIAVTLDPAKLSAFGVSAADVSRALAVANVDLPGGRIAVAGTEFAVRTLGAARTREQLREIRIPLSRGLDVRLGDLGTISDGGAEARSVTRLDGRPAISFQVFRNKGANEVAVARGVARKLGELAAARGDVQFNLLFSLVAFTEASFDATISNFFEGAVLTVLVIFLFLRDRRATLIAAATIPLSIIPTFLVMYALGFTLNTVTLLAVSLVTGVLVDDAIVEIENIHRHMREGRSPYYAAMSAADEIGLAVIATTLVICAVFVPVSMMPGISGQFFIQFGLTVAVAALFSLLVARLLTPMLAAYLMKAPRRAETAPRWLLRYRRLVEWTLDHRLKTLGLAALSMLASFGMVPFLAAGFIPYEDVSQSRVMLELPRGSTLSETDDAASKVMAILKVQPEVELVLVHAGDGAVNVASLDVRLVPPGARDADQRAFEARVLPALQALPDMRVTFANASGEADLSITLVGDDGATLSAAASALERAMRAMPDLNGVSTTAALSQPEIMVTPDFAKAAALGISVEAINDAIMVATIGDRDVALAKFTSGDRQIPIRVRLPHDLARPLDVLQTLKLPTVAGGSVPLSAVAQLSFGTGPTAINRFDRRRQITVSANLNGVALGAALEKIAALPEMTGLPPSVSVQNSGDAEAMGELFGSFAQAIGMGLLLVYAIQVLLYKDWLQPFTRMAALPLSIGGAFVLLLMTGTDFSMPVLIGILMLMGIADKNSILLVDYMLELGGRGYGRRAAIVEACMARARPIIMTSLAMLAGMAPIALGLGQDSAFRAPMAVAVIGGLVSSTALSLVFVPVMFSYVSDFEDWLRPRAAKLFQ